MPLFRALAKNMAASYFGESALRFCNGSYTSVCLYSVTVDRRSKTKTKYSFGGNERKPYKHWSR